MTPEASLTCDKRYKSFLPRNLPSYENKLECLTFKPDDPRLISDLSMLKQA
jgi:hypothetical protein